MSPFGVLKHIKWSSNISNEKSLTKSGYASHEWVISIGYLQSEAGWLQLIDSIAIRNPGNGILHTKLLLFQRSVYKLKLFSVV